MLMILTLLNFWELIHLYNMYFMVNLARFARPNRELRRFVGGAHSLRHSVAREFVMR